MLAKFGLINTPLRRLIFKQYCWIFYQICDRFSCISKVFNLGKYFFRESSSRKKGLEGHFCNEDIYKAYNHLEGPWEWNSCTKIKILPDIEIHTKIRRYLFQLNRHRYKCKHQEYHFHLYVISPVEWKCWYFLDKNSGLFNHPNDDLLSYP